VICLTLAPTFAGFAEMMGFAGAGVAGHGSITV
jgi:hypothetical protein